MARDERLSVDRHSWNDYRCGFQRTALEYVPHYSIPIHWIKWHKADESISDILPLNTAARTIRTGLYGGLAFGLAQDALGFARGRRLGYVDFLLGRSRDTMGMQDTKF